MVNVLHFGDSPISADQISADVRRLLQARFGDAGQGFVLIAKPWAWYNHDGIEMSGHGWRVEAASQNPATDGLHGLGGASFIGGKGATARFVVEQPIKRAELMYQPGGGSVQVNSEVVSTAGARASASSRSRLGRARWTYGHIGNRPIVRDQFRNGRARNSIP